MPFLSCLLLESRSCKPASCLQLQWDKQNALSKRNNLTSSETNQEMRVRGMGREMEGTPLFDYTTTPEGKLVLLIAVVVVKYNYGFVFSV